MSKIAAPRAPELFMRGRGGAPTPRGVLAGGGGFARPPPAPAPEVHAPPLDTGPAIESRSMQAEQQQQAKVEETSC